MSLAGKILTVLVTLMLFACIWLSSQVAALHSNYGEALKNQEKTLVEHTQELADLQVASYATSQQLLAARSGTDNAYRLLNQGLEDVQVRLSLAEETKDRSELLVEAERSINGTTQAARDRRQAEKTDYDARLATTLAELDALAAENDRLIAQAGNLRERFQTLLVENQQLLEQAKSRGLPAFSRTQPALNR